MRTVVLASLAAACACASIGGADAAAISWKSTDRTFWQLVQDGYELKGSYAEVFGLGGMVREFHMLQKGKSVMRCISIELYRIDPDPIAVSPRGIGSSSLCVELVEDDGRENTVELPFRN